MFLSSAIPTATLAKLLNVLRIAPAALASSGIESGVNFQLTHYELGQFVNFDASVILNTSRIKYSFTCCFYDFFRSTYCKTRICFNSTLHTPYLLPQMRQIHWLYDFLEFSKFHSF